MGFIEQIKAFILGVVEGLTEFAPVSSTGHMIIVDDMWLNTADDLGSASATTFKVVIQLGSVLAAAWVFRERYFDMLYLKKNNNFFNKKKLKITHIFIGMIPAGVLGLLFDDFIEENLFSIPTVIVGLFLGAVYMIVADIVNKKYSVKKNLDEITYLQAFIIGLSQSIALWPGFSRSGSTISTGFLLGFSHKASGSVAKLNL